MGEKGGRRRLLGLGRRRGMYGGLNGGSKGGKKRDKRKRGGGNMGGDKEEERNVGLKGESNREGKKEV